MDQQDSQTPPAGGSHPLQTAALPSASDLLRSAWHQFKLRWPTYFGIMIAPLIIVIIFGLVTGFGNNPSPSVTHSTSTINPILFIILVVAMIIAYLWGGVALLIAIKEDGISIGEAYTKAKASVLPYLWVNILVGLIVMVGFILLIIPGILFAFWYGMAQYIVIDQNIRGMNALRKSKEYVKGNIGAIFWRGIVVAFAVAVPIMIITIILKAVGLPDQAMNVVSNILSFIITPFATIYGFMLYRAVKAKKEAEPQPVT
jgi:hypothetical protein